MNGTFAAGPQKIDGHEALLSEITAIVRRTVREFFESRTSRTSAPVTAPLFYENSPVFKLATQIPLFDNKTRVIPMSAITSPGEWTGKRYPLPKDFIPGFFFGFKIGDFSMQPFFKPGDIIFADIRKKLRRGEPATVILKIKGRAPACCLYLSRGNICLIRKAHSKASWQKIRHADIEWCFRAVQSTK